MKPVRNNYPVKGLTPQDLFSRIGDTSGVCWLDSSLHFGDRGHYSFLARRPVHDVILNRDVVRHLHHGRNLPVTGDDNLLRLVERLTAENDLFAIGYIGWEAALPFLGLSGQPGPHDVAEARFLLYQSVLSYDHLSASYSATEPEADDYSDLLSGEPQSTATPVLSANKPPEIRPTMTRSDYLERVAEVKKHIREGDIYQANFTTRFDVRCADDPRLVYNRLRTLNAAPYSAWLDFGDYRILSSSPERMFKKSGKLITTSPIKGTIARGDTPEEEAANLRRLTNSEKDRAELLMIVDLERNDLGRIARTGTVNVDSLFHVEKYSSVMHLVSDISARLTDGADLDTICRSMLPGGSISGAPKKRAVEIINQLENRPRSVYTGCVGYIHGQEADFNIAIRTMLHVGDTYFIHAGGGIVADSQPEAEWEEMMLKARNLFKALGATA